MFLGAWCSLLRSEGFLFSLDVLYEGLEIGKKIAIFDQKNINFFFSCNFFIYFWIGSVSVFSLKCWIRIRIK
jgi:hypothetical protein